MIENRYCVVMCGGVGSRFWPYSRQNKPKQFIDFLGTGRSLLQMTVDRLEGIVPASHIFMLTNEGYASLIKEQLPQLSDEQILLEPARRNTAPCIAWAAWHIKQLNPDAVIMVAPSDHLILKHSEFTSSVERAYSLVETRKDALVTFGIKPTRPETGYGYIQAGVSIDEHFSMVKTFTEKPNRELAEIFVESGEFFWNSGMFFWHVDAIVNAMREYAPAIAEVMDGGSDVMCTPGEMEYIARYYATCPNISIDFAVMEKAKTVMVEKVDLGWSDLGTWGSVYDISPKNRDSNVVQGSRVLASESHGNIVSVKGDKLVVLSGLNDFIIADTPDVLLVVPRATEQKIKNYVNEVKSRYGDRYL